MESFQIETLAASLRERLKTVDEQIAGLDRLRDERACLAAALQAPADPSAAETPTPASKHWTATKTSSRRRATGPEQHRQRY